MRANDSSRSLILIFLLSWQLSEVKSQNHPPSFDIEFKGITFVGDKYCPEVSFNDPRARLSMQKLRNTGANWVAIVVTEYMVSLESTEIIPIDPEHAIITPYYTYKTEPKDGLLSLIKYAHSIGLKVMLKPHIDLAILSDYDKIWRGDIGKKFDTQEKWRQWFKSFQTFISKYAVIAEQLKVEMFSISCELVSTNDQDAHWRKVIETVRSLYKGMLVDSANHDGQEFERSWWDALDYIGVDAYYLPLFQKNQNAEEIDQVLDEKVLQLVQLSEKFNKKVIITEIGFCSGNCRIGKKNYFPNPVDHFWQANMYKRFMNVMLKHECVKGFF